MYPGFQYGAHRGLHAAQITFTGGSLRAMIDGGGAFYPSIPQKPGSHVQDVAVLATFAELPGNPAAVVRTTMKGKGTAILSGVHLEYDMIALIDSNPELEHLRESFIVSRASQFVAFKSLVRMLNLDVVQ